MSYIKYGKNERIVLDFDINTTLYVFRYVLNDMTKYFLKLIHII